jgi:hypothetical protein
MHLSWRLSSPTSGVKYHFCVLDLRSYTQEHVSRTLPPLPLAPPQADSELSYIFSLLPSHHEDMALIEKLDELLEAARRKARTELARNAEVGGGGRGEGRRGPRVKHTGYMEHCHKWNQRWHDGSTLQPPAVAALHSVQRCGMSWLS